MKTGYVLPVLCAIFLLSCPLPAQSQWTHPPTDQCELGYDTDLDRVERAREILKVNAGNYTQVIDYWSIDTVYKEAVVTNDSRQEMLDYLDLIFAWSSDMVLEIQDEIWAYDANGDFVYTAVNQWYGTWDGYTEYVQDGMSIVKFRPEEGCAYYQRDYFTEGDTWIGIPEVTDLIIMMRETYLGIVQKTDECFDYDGDEYSKYLTTGCTYSGVRDCNDFDPDVNPGAAEVLGNGIDDNCDGLIDDQVCGSLPLAPESPLHVLPYFLLYLVPVAFIFLARRRTARSRID